jgi:hypothetical protein
LTLTQAASLSIQHPHEFVLQFKLDSILAATATRGAVTAATILSPVSKPKQTKAALRFWFSSRVFGFLQ